MKPRFIPFLGLAALLSGCYMTETRWPERPQVGARTVGAGVFPEAVRCYEPHAIRPDDRFLCYVDKSVWPLGWLTGSKYGFGSVRKRASEAGGNVVTVGDSNPDLLTGKTTRYNVYYVFDEPAPAP